DLCIALSKRYGMANSFTTQGRMDFYTWVLASQGRLTRLYVWDSEVHENMGTPTAAEVRAREQYYAAVYGSEWDEEEDGPRAWRPGESVVMAIAGEYSACPLDFGQDTLSVGQGFLARTPYGRAHGVPIRPLGQK